MAAERLPIDNPAQPELSVMRPTEDTTYRDEILHDIVDEMNSDRREKARAEAFSKAHGESLFIDISQLLEQRLFEEQQELEAEGMTAQMENTFGRQPLRKRLFGI